MPEEKRRFAKVGCMGQVGAVVSHVSHMPCKKWCGYGDDCVNSEPVKLQMNGLEATANSQETKSRRNVAGRAGR
jgi:hypothetical protein